MELSWQNLELMSHLVINLVLKRHLVKSLRAKFKEAPSMYSYKLELNFQLNSNKFCDQLAMQFWNEL